PPRTTRFPYTTLFRSAQEMGRIAGGATGGELQFLARALGAEEGEAQAAHPLFFPLQAGAEAAGQLLHRAREILRSGKRFRKDQRSEEHTSELQSRENL